MNIINENEYWNSYYQTSDAPESPSRFAMFVAEYLSTDESLLELGCGNGRDAVYFHKQGLRVTAMDKSGEAIKRVITREPGIQGISFEMDQLPGEFKPVFDHVYSRFSIHSINDEQQAQTLKGIKAVLRPSGTLWIEARCIDDEMFEKGTPAGRNAYIYQDHYRRFLVLDEIIGDLAALGFDLIYAEKSRNFAPHKDENPVVIRVRAVKK